jgi:hypothetical protein
MRDKTFSLLSKHLNNEKKTQEYPQYRLYYEQTKPFLLFPQSSALFTTEMEYNGISITRDFTVYYKPC